MPSTIQSLRQHAFKEQGGACCYCNCLMWQRSPDELPCKAPSLRAARQLLCTAEHLQARSAGGGNTAKNIAAACARCNRCRHKRRVPLGPPAFRGHVLRRMSTGRWHAKWVHAACVQMKRS
jgi:hypothetical protein